MSAPSQNPAGGPGSNPTGLLSGGPEQNQPVDLATTSKSQGQTLRIPTVPRPNLTSPVGTGGQIRGAASASGPSVAILGNAGTSATPIRTTVGGPSNARPLLAVPKANVGQSAQVNLAKVTVLTTSNPPVKANPMGANVPRATATTIVRPPTSYPITIKSPGSNPLSATGNATSIRLTTATPSQASVQLVPMSIPATIRPQNSPIRPGASMPRGPTTFRPAATISDAVGVTLVQSPAGSKPGAPQGPSGIVNTTTSSGGFYKQVTITPPNASKPLNPGVSAAMRISGAALPVSSTSRMTVLPATPLQSVSLAPSQQINVPLAPGARAITAGKLITAPTGVTPSGVTIQKSSIPVSSQSPRTISLPYGAATQVASLPKPVSQAIPVARVCPQQNQQNVVTITTTVGNMLPAGSQGQGSVFIARSGAAASVSGATATLGGGATGQTVAINLSSNQATTLNLSKSSASSSLGGLNSARITQPTAAARLVNLPATPVQSLDDAKVSLSNSPSRPSILRRREGDRESAMPDTPPPRPDSRNDDAGSSSSGSTTLSATSSPGLAIADRANLSGGEESTLPSLQPSPRKKPRKQTLTSSSVRQASGSSEAQPWLEESTELKRKLPNAGSKANASAAKASKDIAGQSSGNYIRDKPRFSLLNSYRHTWKSRHNHFLRHSDVRPRVDQMPTVNELAHQKHVMQKINGWKIYHLTSQIEDINDLETELTSRLSSLTKKLDKHGLNEVSKDVGKCQELIKANLQRSKVIQDQMKESKDHILELFEHKSRVCDILHKYMSKRTVKKREK